MSLLTNSYAAWHWSLFRADLTSTIFAHCMAKKLLKKMAGAWRLELQTYGFGDRRSTN